MLQLSNETTLQELIDFFSSKPKGETEPSLTLPVFDLSSKNPDMYTSANGLCYLASTEAFQNLAKTKRPNLHDTRFDFHSICWKVGEEIKTGTLTSKDKAFDLKVYTYSQNNYIADTACKLLTLFFLLNNHYALKGKEVLSIPELYRTVIKNKLTLFIDNQYTTTSVNTKPFFDFFLGENYSYDEISQPGEKLIDFANQYKGRVIHLRKYRDLKTKRGPHSISCMAIDRQHIKLIDTTHQSVNFSIMDKEALKENFINRKYIAYAGVIF
ncbi:MAG: hypothetical protein H7A25_18440 [Leptospiraceae bacterium]|nr:hypothetical protein [Leptospiraceae bacterium]MCP5501886.1 hypothetical protein [Leptospiraceae bacterium]